MTEDDHPTASRIEEPQLPSRPDAADRLIGSVIGPYKLLDLIGEGGFGVVYVAEQTEPVKRRVALKLIKLGMDTKRVIARFDAERQALAMMDHAHVARVFDAGVSDDGRPYFVMEYVPGVPITEHCDRQRFGIDMRLRLFIQVCSAVQHAHQKGIIHRDLKPSNVLVSLRDGVADVKVIDFGMAKALHQKLTEKTLFTERGQLIGTPEYMSPEQAEMTAQDVDTRSDIYSLGVLLYQLLTGALPFDPRSMRKAAFAEIQRIIREQEPAKPSTKLSSLGDDSISSAQKRQLDPRSLLRELRGDLDWIVMKALQKDREMRYETANELVADIERHFNNEPVLAGPPSAAYRLRKSLRKHRMGVTVACAVFGVLILGTVGTTWGWIEAIEAREAETTAKAEAQTEQQIARAVNDFLNNDLLAAVAPSAEKGTGKDVLMRDVLDRAAERIEDESVAEGRFHQMPLVEASIRMTLGTTYRRLGELSAAETHLKRARLLLHQELGEEHSNTLATMNNLANLFENQGRYDEAEPLFVRVFEMRKRVLGLEHRDTLRSMNNLALLYTSQGRYDEAEPLLVSTIEIVKCVCGEDNLDLLRPMGNLARLLRVQGRYDEAEPVLVDTLETMKRVLGEEHPDTLSSMNNLANLYLDQDRYDDAEPLYLRTLEIRRRLLGEAHPSLLFSMMNLGELYIEQERFEEAEALQAQAVVLSRRAWSEESWFIGAFLGTHGQTLLDLGRFEDAERALAEAYEILVRAVGSDHERTIAVVTSLAALHAAWHEAQPDKGHDARAAKWREPLADAESDG